MQEFDAVILDGARVAVVKYPVDDRGPMILDQVSEPCAAAGQLAREHNIFDSLPNASQYLRIWQPLPALIATPSEANLPGFAAAAARALERGLPVHVRRSGGGAVCLGPGMLVVTHLYRSRRNDLDGSYREFAGALMRATAKAGVFLSAEHVASAYCDGKFDMAWHGLKVGGIAQRRRILADSVHVWIHAVLAIESKSLHYPQAVTQFYMDIGSARIADSRSTTCLSQCLPLRASEADLLPRCAAAIAATFSESMNVEALLEVDGTC